MKKVILNDDQLLSMTYTLKNKVFFIEIYCTTNNHGAFPLHKRFLIAKKR